MKKYCANCKKLVEIGHVCGNRHNWKSYRYGNSTEQRNIRNTTKWQKKRDEIKHRDGGVDQIAVNGLAGAPYIETRNLQVHHIEPLAERPDLAFDNDNLITVSPRTHELAEDGTVPRWKLHDIARMNNAKAGMDTDGTAAEKEGNVFVVSGSPGSGKSRYVFRHKGADDIVWDMDLICEALRGNSGGVRTDHTQIIGMGVKMRDVFYREVREHGTGWEKGWVITAEPNPGLVRQLCNDLKAEHIHIRSTLEECMKHIEDDPLEHDKEKRMKLAKRWHEMSEALGGFTFG